MWIKDYVKVALMNIQCWKISENALQWSQSAMFEIGLDGFGEVRTENTLCRLGDPPTCQTDIFSFAFGGKALLESNENHSTFRNFTSCRYLLKNEIRGRGQKEEWNVVCVMMRMKRTARFEKQWLWDIFFLVISRIWRNAKARRNERKHLII